MTMRVSGMISGLDTDALVQELVSAYSTKKDKYVKQKTKLEWTQDAWKSLNTKTYDFYINKLSDMRFSKTYSKKKTTSSNESKATVSASGTAVNGTQKLKVIELATTGYLTGAELKAADGKKAAYTGNTKLSEAGFSGSGNITVSVDGKDYTFGVGENTTFNNVVSQLKTAGLNASFDEKNQRFFISSKTSGEEADFSLTGDANGIEALKAMGTFSASKADLKYYEKVANYSDDDITNLALNDYLKQKVNAQNSELTAANKSLNAELAYMQDTVKARETLDKNIEENEKALREKLGLGEGDPIEIQRDDDGNITSQNYLDLSDADKKTVDDLLAKQEAYQKTKETYDNYDSSLGGMSTEDRVEAIKQEITDNSDKIKDNTTLISKTYTTEELKEKAGEFIDFDETSGTPAYKDDAAFQTFETKYTELRQTAKEVYDASQTTGGVSGLSDATRIVGRDSEIELNGATFTSNTNIYSINGLTITAMGKTDEDEEISITTETDVDGIYNMVKDFLKSYNELMTEMQTSYNADSSKGYEPLTDDEKEAMTDDEIEKWEKKIKDSLLRRDDTLSGIMNAMQLAMSQSYVVGGKRYSLSSFGIKTGSYFATDTNQRGTLHIDGDSDDGTSSGNEDKLRKAIAEDPDAFVEAFSKITEGLYDTLTKKMSRSTLSSAYTIYNDKYMQSQQKDLEKTISKWEEKIDSYEEKYYNQFTAMEKALASLQSQTSALAGLLGG